MASPSFHPEWLQDWYEPLWDHHEAVQYYQQALWAQGCEGGSWGQVVTLDQDANLVDQPEFVMGCSGSQWL